MIEFEPKYITFDCYGTLTKFRMADMTREMYGNVLNARRYGEARRVLSRAIAVTKCWAHGSRIATWSSTRCAAPASA